MAKDGMRRSRLRRGRRWNVNRRFRGEIHGHVGPDAPDRTLAFCLVENVLNACHVKFLSGLDRLDARHFAEHRQLEFLAQVANIVYGPIKVLTAQRGCATEAESRD